MALNDAHCHFFSSRFFETLGRQRRPAVARAQPDVSGLSDRELRLASPLEGDIVSQLTGELGWEHPGSPEDLARRWVAELDRAGVTRATLIASVPGDEESIAVAVRKHPERLVGFFMLDATAPDAVTRAMRAIGELGLRGICLFPAMHRYRLDDDRVLEIVAAAAARPGTAIFAHCGFLSVGVRKKLGLASQFDIRLGQPLDLQRAAFQHPHVPIIVPHFGAGFFREALMLADLCPNVYLDTSSSNGWIRYEPDLSLRTVFSRALDVVGAGRLLFGTDSSFFPRGWQRGIYEQQRTALDDLQVSAEDRTTIFHDNFDRLFPVA